jgi:pimeloyl-ACP methyl ester carboxylesterase
MKEQKYFFKNKENIRLCGILTRPGRDTKSCVILCHGITSDKEEDGIFTNLARKLAIAGFAVFRFDFRGHGESGDKSINLTVSGQERDLETAFNFLVNKGYDKFGLVAASFAGGSVCFFAPKHQNKIKALVLWNSVINFTTFYRLWLADGGKAKLKKQGFIVRNNFKLGSKLFEETFRLKPWKELKKLSIPLLFIHGDKDTKVPYSDSVRYANMLKARLETIRGGEHGFHNRIGDSNQANLATVEFFEKHLIR